MTELVKLGWDVLCSAGVCVCFFKKSYLVLNLVNYHSEVIQKELFNFAKQEVVD